MWGTGLRIRFFWIIFFVLTIVAIGATFLHGFLIYKERYDLVDQQVRDTASALLDSEINGLRKIEIERVEEILSEELGETRIGKFFIIRNALGEKIFESTSARLLPVKYVPQNPQWISIKEKGKFIRILNLKLPRIPDRTLQVGVVIDDGLISPNYFSFANLAFIGIIFLLGLGAAWGLTSTLLQPISKFVEFITSITRESPLPLPQPPKLSGNQNRRDELVKLIEGFSLLVEKVNRSHKLSRSWSYQMAHELKTPLAVAEGEIASAKRSGEISPKVAARVSNELMEASETVTDFLTWAELDGISAKRNLFAVSARKAILEIQQRLAIKYSERLKITAESDFYVLASPQHFEHMILNLILNALQYSPDNREVEVNLDSSGVLTIRDFGNGIPKEVLERIGEPFNKGDSYSKSAKGHGLGLAYVQSVCNLYGWKIEIQTGSGGSTITLYLPKN